MMKKIGILLLATITLFACNNNENDYDAAGSFEAVEVIVSAQGTGTIDEFSVKEGAELKKGEVVGYIDSTQLVLRKEQLSAMKGAVVSRKPDISSQLAVYRSQLEQAERERNRLERLVKADAATQKQLDDANAQVDQLKKQISAQEKALRTTTNSLNQETIPLNVQRKQIDDQLKNYNIVNPIVGTVIAKYAEESEVTTVGQPLYKIANLSNMTLRAYISGSQLGLVKIGQTVTVRIDAGEDQYREYEGVIEWISSKAEFTPKTIQTKDERENLVYASKIKVKNDGYIKIGMYGEAIFNQDREEE